MASIGRATLFLTVVYIIGGNAEGFVKVHCKSESVGQHGRGAKLECFVKITKAAANVQILVVAWKKDGDEDPLLVFERGNLKHRERFLFAEPSWTDSNMDVSLLIANTTVQDEGDYECTVLTDSGHHTNHTSLKVTARYNKPTIRSIPEKITQDTDGDLVCRSDGGYPEGQMRWFDEHGHDWTKAAEMEAEKTVGGLFRLTSKLRKNTSSKYKCAVYNASGGREEEATFEILNKPGEFGGEKELDLVKIVAPMVVIGSLIVGLLLLLAVRYYRNQSRQLRRPSATPLVGGHRGVRTSDSDVEEGQHQDTDRELRDIQT